MDKSINKDLLRQALELYEDNWLGDFSEENAFAPSEKFEKKMSSLLKTPDSFIRRATFTRTRRVIAIAAAVAVLLASMMSVGAIRETILSFFITHTDNLDVLEYTDTPEPTTYPETIKKAYTPGYIPRGYRLDDTVSAPESQSVFYTNGDLYLSFEQFTKKSYRSASDSDFSKPVTERYGGTEYIVRTAEDMTMLIWEKNGYVFELVGFMPKAELLKIADSARGE